MSVITKQTLRTKGGGEEMRKTDLIWVGIGFALASMYGIAWILFMRMWIYWKEVMTVTDEETTEGEDEAEKEPEEEGGEDKPAE